MAFNTKRKFDDAEEFTQCAYVPAKHTKVASIAEPVVTEDVDMGNDDAPSPTPSLASLATTASSHNSPAYPHFDLYPFPTSGDADMIDSDPAFDPRKQASNRSDSTVGLMQPQTATNDFVHHGWVSLLAGFPSKDLSSRLLFEHVLTLLDPPWMLMLLAPTVRRSPAFAWPLILVLMGVAAFGVTALNVAPSKWFQTRNQFGLNSWVAFAWLSSPFDTSDYPAISQLYFS
ncbi:hypothetical protein OPQ81_010532 [Rhizoctonia solani]|nr:hypothetical protein OPQ81_010532 [Rhizoctonia solani]